ncbi:MAG: MBL fold metallo-hydrolase [Bacteroidales bacterium]|nr:MBL fold metallo-hydrolase [Bacteroidales bacterium]
MIHIQEFTFNSFQTRCSVFWDDSLSCAIVDPGCSSDAEIAELKSFISAKGLKPICIMLTHGHFDHVLGVAELACSYSVPCSAADEDSAGSPACASSPIPVYMHPADKVTLAGNSYFSQWFGAPLPASFETTDICEGSVIEIGTLRFKVIETPGHTPGGVSFYEPVEKVLFSGDSLFAGAIGRTDHPGGDYDQLMKSILEKLVTLDGSVTVFPGHGPCTDIAREGMTNPFLLPFNEPFEE